MCSKKLKAALPLWLTFYSDIDEATRRLISKISESTIDRILKSNRTQMANWILVRFASQCSDADIQQIRAENVNELAVLEAILKKARKTGKLPSDMSQLIHKHLGFQEPARKSTKSKLTKNIINDDMTEMEE
jgi:hypothetical protein